MSYSEIELGDAAFEYAPEPALLLDADRRVVLRANLRARELLGNSTRIEEVFGREFTEEWRALPEGKVARMQLGGVKSPTIMDCIFSRIDRAEDSLLWLLSLHPLARDPGEERRRTREMELMGQLARGVARNFKNVLQAIRLARDQFSSQEEGRFVVGVSDALTLGEELLQTLYALASSPPGAKRRLVDMRALVVRCEGLVRQLAGSIRKIEFEMEGERETLVEGDEGQLLQVVMSLVLHARSSIQQAGGSSLAVRLERHGDEVELIVRDDGRGISSSQLQLLFEDGFEGKGGGGDLAAIRHIVDVHGGHISVLSPIIGSRGTEFRVLLPCAKSTVCNPPEEDALCARVHEAS